MFGAFRHPLTINGFDFTKPMGTRFIGDSLFHLNGVSGFAEHFVTHDLRSGAVRDITFIPPSKILGVANNATAKAVGHTRQALNSGVTDMYIGALNQDLNQLKWTHQVEEDYSIPRQGAPPRRKGSRLAISAAITKRLPEKPLHRIELKKERDKIGKLLRKEAEIARLRS